MRLLSSMTNNGRASPGEMFRRIATLIVCFGIYWCLSGAVLWWMYDIDPLIRGGFYERNQALVLVSKMGLIISVLTTIVWLLAKWRPAGLPRWRLGWKVAWKTAVILTAYALIVLLRRQLWTPSQGMNDYAAFLPIVGHVNGQFLSEFGWLSFLLQVVPTVALLSGVLYYLQVR